jgi:hypothetical protein
MCDTQKTHRKLVSSDSHSFLKQIKNDGFRSATVFNVIAVVKLMSYLAITSQEDYMRGGLSTCSCKGVYDLAI